jgi:outer membrane receptor for ferrienterochelin and colicins
MAFCRDPRELSRNLRLALVYGVPLSALSAMFGSAALAQAPALPSAPAVPSGLPSAVPTGVPSGVPTGVPSGLPTGIPAPPAGPPALPPPTPGGEKKPAAPSPPLDKPTDSNVVFYDGKAQTGDDEGPAGKPPSALHPGPGSTDADGHPVDDPLGLKADEYIVSASNRKETSRSALGWVIVISAKELRQRGYTDLSQILDDLPGMDVIRPYGDTYVRPYVRGYRSVGADPIALMMDGVPLNQLFTGSMQIIAALPLSSIDHIEIVYSPSSVVYGPGAAMGVVNVITVDGKARQDAQQYGATFGAWITFGGPQSNFTTFGDTTKLVDVTASYISKDYRVRISARLESSVLDTGIGSQFPFTSSSAYTSTSAWGAGTLETYPGLAGAFHSPDRKGAVDARVFLGKGTEIAAQFFTLSTGYGTEYPGDQRQNAGLFTTRELGLYARHVAQIADGVKSTTLVQYRQSDLYATSLTSDGTQVKLLNAESPGAAATVQQDFDVTTRRGLLLKTDTLGFNFGLQYRHLELPGSLTGANVVSSSVWSPNADPATAAMAGADQVTGAPVPSSAFDEIGAHVLSKYAFNDAHALSLAARVDKSSERTDVNFSFRGGYAGSFLANMLGLKIWYGHSIFAPSWQENLLASVPSNQPLGLKVDRMHTVEGDVDFRLPFLSVHVDGYFIYTTHPAVATTADPSIINADGRKLAGLDAGARLLFRPIYFWAYYTHTFLAEDSLSAADLPNGVAMNAVATNGDIASDKVWAGLTFEWDPFSATLLNRWVTDRTPVVTNSAGTSSWYTTLDANLMVSNLGTNGLWFAARCTNIIGTQYDQPGIQSASSGNAGTASAGPYNSHLPQPGRAFFVTAGFTFDPDKPVTFGK